MSGSGEFSPQVAGLLTAVFGIFFGSLIFDDVLPPSFIGALLLVGVGLILVNSN